MAFKTSTGLRNYMLDNSSLASALSGGLIKVYSGDAPASADAAVTGTLLCTVSLNSTGAGFDLGPAASGTIAKVANDVLSGVVAVSGTAGYYRHVGAGDTGTSSTSEARIQGAVSTTGTEMNLSSVVLVAGATQTIDYYTISLPTF